MCDQLASCIISYIISKIKKEKETNTMGYIEVKTLLKSRVLLLAAVITAAAILPGCGTKLIIGPPSEQSTAAEPETKEQQLTTSDDIVSEMALNERNWLNLSQEQYLEDFDYLYHAMKENYPYFGVVKRQSGIDIHERYESARKEMERCESDFDFFRLTRDFINELDFTGHIFTWNASYYRFSVENWQEFVTEFPENKTHLKPYLEALDNPVSKAGYAAMEAFYEPVYAEVDKRNGTAPAAPEDETFAAETEELPNVQTRIIEDGNIAYVSIGMFDMNCYKEDQDKLLDFYKQVSNYNHLIIDISENGGGGMSYYSDLVVAPNIDAPLSVSVYALVKGGDINQRFFMDESIAEDEWKPIAQLPKLPDINLDDLADLDFFTDTPYEIAPSGSDKLFQGKIWLLVSKINYSSAEYAAMFTKHSGFATLVGENTGGDGIGIDPAYIVLPASGLIVQYSPVYGVTADGTGSEECGTAPDIAAAPGETELDACLRAIRSR